MNLQAVWEWTEILWSLEDPHPCPRDFFSLLAVPDNRLVLFAGLDSVDKKLDDTWIFSCDRSGSHPSGCPTT